MSEEWRKLVPDLFRERCRRLVKLLKCTFCLQYSRELPGVNSPGIPAISKVTPPLRILRAATSQQITLLSNVVFVLKHFLSTLLDSKEMVVLIAIVNGPRGGRMIPWIHAEVHGVPRRAHTTDINGATPSVRAEMQYVQPVDLLLGAEVTSSISRERDSQTARINKYCDHCIGKQSTLTIRKLGREYEEHYD